MSDNYDDVDLTEKVPLTRWNMSDLARTLGSIESTLKDMRGDIQAGTTTQNMILTQMKVIDQRVGALEIKDLDRSRFRQAAGRVTLVLLVPVIVAATQVHEWFNTVNDIIFPRK